MTVINRRRALTGSAAIAVGVPVLAACGSADSTAQNPGTATQGDGVLEIPSPGALALLGLAGLAGRRRRG